MGEDHVSLNGFKVDRRLVWRVQYIRSLGPVQEEKASRKASQEFEASVVETWKFEVQRLPPHSIHLPPRASSVQLVRSSCFWWCVARKPAGPCTCSPSRTRRPGWDERLERLEVLTSTSTPPMCRCFFDSKAPISREVDRLMNACPSISS